MSTTTILTQPGDKNLEIVVRTITDRFIAGIFATAEMYSFIFGSVKIVWFKLRSHIRSIAEWLVSTFSTSAPMIFTTRFNIDVIGAFLCNDWFGHRFSPILYISIEGNMRVSRTTDVRMCLIERV